MRSILAVILSIGFLFAGLGAAVTKRDELAGTGNADMIATITNVTGLSIEVLGFAVAFGGVAAILLSAMTIWRGGGR